MLTSLYFTLASTLVVQANILPRQASRTLSALDQYPTGVEPSRGQWEDLNPIPCVAGCHAPYVAYTTCFVETNLSYTDQYGEYHEINTDPSACNAYFCQPPNYDLLVDCLDCIIANGNQRPLGYHTNSALGASAAIPSEYEGYGIEYSPQGFVDATLANGWLKNVTNSCSKAGKPLGNVQSSLTATPTTTGPYFTTWTQGQTVVWTQWTGLAEYGEPTAILLTSGAVVPTAVVNSPTAGGVAPSASTSGAAVLGAEVGQGTWWFGGLLGMVLAALA